MGWLPSSCGCRIYKGPAACGHDLAEQEPNDLELRLNLLDLAFQTGNSDEIDKNIKQIEQIEGNDGFAGSLLPGALPDLAGRASQWTRTRKKPCDCGPRLVSS